MQRDSQLSPRAVWGRLYLAGLVLIVFTGALLRLRGLGARSLWLDEFCTWHVSRMPLGASLRWPPELSKPPLYQFCLRLLTRAPRPPEWLLRLPAAAFGTLVIAAGAWLGRLCGGRRTALALAALLAANPLQRDYSQEARSYSLLVLGCALSITCWYRLVMQPSRRFAVLYAAATVMAIHAHYLAALTIAAEVAWWLIVSRGGSRRQWTLPAVALGAAGALCAPIVIHVLCRRASMFEGLGWIPPATWSGAARILAKLSCGRAWAYCVLPVSMALWAWMSWRPRRRGVPAPSSAKSAAAALLVLWLLSAWLGLVMISWVANPLLIARYALPAAVPAMLLPLLAAARLHRHAPLILAGVFLMITAPEWLRHGAEVSPGFRELVQYLNEHADPESSMVAILIENVTHPDWADMQRLGFDYYPLQRLPVCDLYLAAGAVERNRPVLADPRTLYIVVFLGDPLPLIHAAGRRTSAFRLDGQTYSQLLFTPYRLLQVAPVACADAQ